MSGSRRLIVSLPGRELQTARLPGSIFGADQLPSEGLSVALREAIRLVLHHAGGWDLPTLFVARPEIFPEGETLAWLRSRTEGATTHVSISDGSAIKIIPDLRNHVFFYNSNDVRGETAITALVKRSSEQLLLLKSQWNSAYALRCQGKNLFLPTTVLSGCDPADESEQALFRFYLDKGNLPASMEKIAALPAVDVGRLNDHAEVVCIHLTEAMLAVDGYRSILGKLVLQHFFDSRTALLFVLPEVDDATKGLTPALEAFLAAIRDTSSPVPKIAADNIFIAFGDLSAAALESVTVPVALWLSDGAAMWRHPPSYYEAFESVTIHCRRSVIRSAQFSEMAHVLLGREFDFVPVRLLAAH